MLLGGSGLFIDTFAASGGDAIVWISGQGNVFEVELGAGEQIDVEAGGWLYKDTSVKLESVSLGLKTGMFAGDHKMTFNRFTGPGRLAIQTLYLEPVEGEGGGSGRGGVGRRGRGGDRRSAARLIDGAPSEPGRMADGIADERRRLRQPARAVGARPPGGVKPHAVDVHERVPGVGKDGQVAPLPGDAPALELTRGLGAHRSARRRRARSSPSLSSRRRGR